MFNRARFCFFDRLDQDGFAFLGPKNLPLNSSGPKGETLEATYYVVDKVWKVLDCEASQTKLLQ